MEGTHALSLKVMRISRPTLATHSAPYFTEPNGGPLTEHARSSILSLERSAPLASYPSTLRDYPLSEVLLLPASFGTIQLGETFAAVICINNDSVSLTHNPAPIYASSVYLKVEIQSTSNKAAIGETGSESSVLKAGGFMECKVQVEMKELGQHVLACTLTYRIPGFIATTYPVPPDDPSDPTLRTLRKYYKFMVTNPLSVKTKVQTLKSSNALLRPSERDKVFLEVHLQNLSSGPMTFQRIRFECAPNSGLKVRDLNDALYDNTRAGMSPGDTRQYLYVLSPRESDGDGSEAPPERPSKQAPGSTVPLGRLDIAWTSSFGEPGRLLTSMLSRKIAPLPIPAPLNPNANTAGTSQPISSLPPYMYPKIAIPPHVSGPASSISRPHSPTVTTSTSTPGSRPGSPFRVRNVGTGPMSRSQSPSLSSLTSSSMAPLADRPPSAQGQGGQAPPIPTAATSGAFSHLREATLSVLRVAGASSELGSQLAVADTSGRIDEAAEVGAVIKAQEPFHVRFRLDVQQTPSASATRDGLSMGDTNQMRTTTISIQRTETRALDVSAESLVIGGSGRVSVPFATQASGSGLFHSIGDPAQHVVSNQLMASSPIPSHGQSISPFLGETYSTRGFATVTMPAVDALNDHHIGNKGGYSLNTATEVPSPFLTPSEGIVSNAGLVPCSADAIVSVGPSLVKLGSAEMVSTDEARVRYEFKLEYVALRKGLQGFGGGLRVFSGGQIMMEVSTFGDIWVV
ncbi:uncharacterized protein EI90DRAFT_3043622 [Cantharellus anzutake]|uniref:uncharacterized protein n=1 Tax=Cantharellus anzutake TaxID=1750568 RepID=UPI00190776ED|nr:uncharacterized protein EI90DRAFT_3043622 [Cantharellus anzutake]KAF8337622.1 hypothetical protein EI90DRAFT_3043622 [Cantharellus anzutake]